jgi:hypothetical protein
MAGAHRCALKSQLPARPETTVRASPLPQLPVSVHFLTVIASFLVVPHDFLASADFTIGGMSEQLDLPPGRSARG